MEYYTIDSDDGYKIRDIPKDIDPTDPRVKARYEQMKSQGITNDSFAGINPGVMDPSQVPGRGAMPQQQSSMGQEAVKGLKQGTAATVRGLATGAANAVGVVVDPAVVTINAILDAVGAPPEIRGATLGQATKNLLDLIGVPESDTMAAKIVESASRGLGGAATGIGVGGAIAGTAPALGNSMAGAVGNSMASGALQQATGGVGSEVASQVAGDMGAGAGVQMAAGLAGGLAGSTAGNLANLRKAPVNAMQDVVDNKRFRTELRTSDIFPPETPIQKAGQKASENILFGTGPGRVAQQKDRIEDIKDTIRRFGGYDAASASDEVMSDLISKRQTNFNRWENMKEEALKAVEKAKPGATVPMTKTIKSIDESISHLKSLNNPDLEPAMQKLINAKQSFKNQTPANVLKNKQILGDIFDAPEMGALKRTASSELKKTYDAVKDDLTEFIGEAGGAQAKNKWGIANAEETKLFKELDLDILKNTLEKGVDRPEVVKNMLFNKDRSVIQALNKNLTAKGREAAKTAIMQRVADKIGDDASPDKFLTEMRKLRSGSDPVGIFFTGDDLEWIEGLTRVLKASDRASKFALNPPTGQQLYLPAGIAAGAAVTDGLSKVLGGGSTGATLAAGLGIGGLGIAGLAARAYESPAVRNILMKLPALKAGTAEETALFNRLFEVIKAQENKEQK